MYLIFFISSTVDGHLDCFQFGAIMNNATMNSCIQLFAWMYVSFLLVDSRSKIDGPLFKCPSYGEWINRI